ncbi:WecB/TagA/CpsF family glycosyltransferase [Arthrobacter mangrovi]|uniref:Glycosyl transferase n=1 Tax=Arthrobacter mangrovi TaxID=2966350 RepID=A0ABQ5MX88_9MICC|nr:WecB/TagA/CpsF family glycosyltransferase [Arthrobacter mangrovi]GLB68297.1 glycosyl transferase [Arthrobacter mangrovi]
MNSRDRSFSANSRELDAAKRGNGKLPYRALPVFETHVTPLTADELLRELTFLITQRGRVFIGNHNLHSLYLNLTDSKFSRLYSLADFILIDGFPILCAANFEAVARRAPGVRLRGKHRIGSLDWVPRLGEVAGLRRVAMIGASPQANAEAVKRLSATSPHIAYRGWEGSSWNQKRSMEVIAEVRAFRPQLTLVGLGMPLQEHFLEGNLDSLPDGVYATVGGAFDQIAGLQKAAPRFLGDYGVEWLWRLLTQPRRLGYRYLVEPWKLLAVLTRKQIIRKSKYGQD